MATLTPHRDGGFDGEKGRITRIAYGDTNDEQRSVDFSMSKYDALWKYIQENGTDSLKLTFDEIGAIGGVPLDHSFLNYKKELKTCGWQVGKISMKEQTVTFERAED